MYAVPYADTYTPGYSTYTVTVLSTLTGTVRPLPTTVLFLGKFVSSKVKYSNGEVFIIHYFVLALARIDIDRCGTVVGIA